MHNTPLTCMIKVLFHAYDICYVANQWWAINGLIHKDGDHCEKGEVAKMWYQRLAKCQQ